jgi:hypothetical protein
MCHAAAKMSETCTDLIYLFIALFTVMMVVVGSSKTYVARLLNRPAEGSDVVC